MKIKKIMLSSLTLLFNIHLVVAQNVSVNSTGTAPVNSAMLDISASDKGVLIPRVNLISSTDVATIASPATSLLVYNTNASMTNGAGTGYYYWRGDKWIPVTMSSGGGVCGVSMGTNELDGAGAPCAGTACGTLTTSLLCATYCNNLTYSGYSDWRMPTVDELVNLVSLVPGNTSANYIWTSIPSTGITGYLVTVQLTTLSSLQYDSAGGAIAYCRCVR